MLKRAYRLRSLVLLVDGVDEAAGLKQFVEAWVLRGLMPHGVRVVLTSRPEGVRAVMYKESFVIMDLKPLSMDQQASRAAT